MSQSNNSYFRIPLFKIYWKEEYIEAVARVIRSGMNWATGSSVTEFEEAISHYIGTRYAVTFNSGTSALHAALLAFNIEEGDEVIVPSFTFIATANSVLFVRAKPVFADIEEETLGLDPEDVKEKITPRTKAIIAVHYAGSPCKIKEIKEIAEDYKLILIEDAAEAFGARIGDEKVGTFGDASVFSFCQNKIITTGEGGAVLTDDHRLYERLKLIRSHGRVEEKDYFSSPEPGEYITLGYNWRLSNIAAALGLAQMKDVDEIIELRRRVAQTYIEELSRIKGVKLPIPPPNYFHVYQLFTIRVPEPYRDGLINYMIKKGIGVKIYFHPVHLTRFYRSLFGFKGGELPVTEKISREVISLPMYPSLTKNEINYVIESIKEFFTNK